MTTSTSRQRRARRGGRDALAVVSCCCGLLLATNARVASAVPPSPLPIDGLQQQQTKAVGGLGAPSFDTRARTLSILHSLRAGQHPLEVLDEALPGGEGEVGFAMTMRGWDGQEYVCAPVLEPRPSDNDSMDEFLPPLPPPPPATAPAQPGSGKGDEKLAALDNTCALLGGSAANGDEYWSYEWCHRKEIRQFHLSTAGGGTAADEQVRDPNWSLGKYVGTEIRHVEAGAGSAAGQAKGGSGGGSGRKVVDHIIDRYEGGQRCDETRAGRRAAVRFFCCEHPSTLPADVQEVVLGMKPVPFAVAQLAAIREVSVCNYTLTVCTPLLCDATVVDPSSGNGGGGGADANAVAPLTGAAAKSPVLRLLEPLAHFCLQRHEGYWSYEFCYKRGIRQYHNVAVRDPKGRVTSKVESEYTIGRQQPTYGEAFNETDHIVQGEGDADPTHFAMEYTGGTECDLTGRQRSSTVVFVCGDAGTDQFVSVKEDRSCHYRVVIATPRLCRHPAFRKQLPSTRTVRCLPVGEGQQQHLGAGAEGGGASKKAKKGKWFSSGEL